MATSMRDSMFDRSNRDRLALEPPFVQRLHLPEENLALYKDGNLCTSCQGINLDALLSANGYIHEPPPKTEVSTKRRHKITNLLGALKLANRQRHNYCILNESLPISLKWDAEYSWIRCKEIGVAEKQNGIILSPPEKFLRLCTDDGTIASQRIPTRRPVLISTLEYCADLTRQWIEKSWDQTDEYIHHPCDLPKRVIDVSGSKVLLRDFSAVPLGHPSRQDVYVALSHRWGPQETMLRTLKSTISMMTTTGVALKALSLGIQEAIQLTRLLGLKYIWIDCICIVQDSKEDWDEESSKMNTYYSSSWLTIAIGLDSNRGCIPTRKCPRDVYRIVSNGDILYVLDDSESYQRPYLSRSILATRGWAYQEEILSPRYLCFLEDQIVFRCGERIFSDSGHLASAITSSPTDLRTMTEDYDHLSIWQGIVVTYVRRELTKGEDKLPALSGIAHEYSKRETTLSGDYLAGLWSGDFLPQLLWFRKFWESARSPPCYRAPSWSWASIDGEITFLSNSNNGPYSLDVLHASTKLDGTDPMGKVKGGSLTVHGFIRAAKIYQSSPVFYISHYLRSFPDEWERECGEWYHFTIYLDVYRDETLETEDIVIYLLDVNERWSLILVSVPKTHPNWNENTYQRIGLGGRSKIAENWMGGNNEELEHRRWADDTLRLKDLSRLEVVHII